MYSPNFYRLDETSFKSIQLIQKYPFALLLSSSGEQVSHLPFMFENSDNTSLVAHMARANPHWRELQSKPKSKIIFQGPHGYISPSWYRPEKDNVPTWNYAVTHVTGEFEIISEARLAYSLMSRMVSFFESKYETNWQLPENEKAVEDLMKGIVVFKIVNLKFESKFKLGQMLDLADRNNVIAELNNKRGDELKNLADLMAQT